MRQLLLFVLIFSFMADLTTCDLGLEPFTILILVRQLPSQRPHKSVATDLTCLFCACMCLCGIRDDHMHIRIFSGKVRQFLFYFPHQLKMLFHRTRSSCLVHNRHVRKNPQKYFVHPGRLIFIVPRA
jgi:hypothetical protein